MGVPEHFEEAADITREAPVPLAMPAVLEVSFITQLPVSSVSENDCESKHGSSINVVPCAMCCTKL